MADIIDIAIREIGYKESGSNSTKYGKWYGMNGVAWCHIFVSWCAYKAGVSTSIFPKTASTTTGMDWFKKKGLFKKKGSYTPKRGDVVYFKTGRSHVGLVEKVSGSTLHTIEGNTSDRVARRTYPLSNSSITGYGVPKYKEIGGNSSGNSLSRLKKVLNAKSVTLKRIDTEVKVESGHKNVSVSVLIANGNKQFTVPVLDDMQLVLERCGSPGKLTFKTLYDSKFKIQEGNSVLLIVDKKKVFYGFVFTKDRTKDGSIGITAYDQLRYFKNKDTYVFKNKTASEMIKRIASDYYLKVGSMADTGYRMSVIKDDETLIDIIQDAIDETMLVKGKIYVLHDKCGRLVLKDIKNMYVDDSVIDADTAEDYSYKSTIDSDVYNKVKLIYENNDTGTYDLYVVQDSKNINSWGVLQYTEKINDSVGGKIKANAMLNLYDKKKRNLTINSAIGNTKVIGGSLVPVFLNVGDLKIQNYMLVEKVTHKFSNHVHRMDLILSGGEFSV